VRLQAAQMYKHGVSPVQVAHRLRVSTKSAYQWRRRWCTGGEAALASKGPGGAVRAVESITTGLQWRAVRPPVCVTGPPGKADLEACWELGALLRAEVAG
jgi:transposase-like protein